MKREYDFSQAERGKFYRPDAQFHLPIYLEPDIADFLQQLAEKTQSDVSTMANSWLRKDMELIQLAS
jgi:hypothetical protein